MTWCKLKNGFCVCVWFLLGMGVVNSQAFELGKPGNAVSTTTHQSTQAREKNLVVQLAIFCDSKFSAMLNGNENKALEYWKSVFNGVHLQYQSLPSFNFSFQITSLKLIKEPLAFVNNHQHGSGEVNLRGVLFGMSNWLGPQLDQMPPFDIALFATGAEALYAVTAETQDSICLENSVPDSWVTNIVVSVRTSDIVQEIAHAIRRVFGVSLDDAEYSWKPHCKTYNGDWFLVNRAEYFEQMKEEIFRLCFDRIFLDLFNGSAPLCLKPDENNTQVLYDSASLVFGSLSVQEQCQLRSNIQNVTVDKHETCSWKRCRAKEHSDEKTKLLMPLNGSPCKDETDGVCFRGSCVLNRVELFNLKTLTCIDGNSKVFKPVLMKECSFGKLPQTERISLIKDQNNGTLLIKSYFGGCLKIDTDGILKTDSCFHSLDLGWELVKLDNQTNDRFMIRHLATDSCIQVSCDSGSLITSSECNSSDLGMQWKLVLGNETVLTHENYDKYIQTKTMSVEFKKDEKPSSFSNSTFLFIVVLVCPLLLGSYIICQCLYYRCFRIFRC